jgi:hypothetical protein
MPHFKNQDPPVFWASSRIPVAGVQSQIEGILLRTGQPDVIVLVDNFQFGRTSSTGELRIPLPPASYNIRLEKPGFRPIATSVLVAKNSETPITLKLEREVAPQFSVRAGLPGAMVRVDGKEVGVVKADGTFIHEAGPGTHTIELEKAGYLPAREEITLVSGSTTTVDATMHPDTSLASGAEAAAYDAIAASTDPAQLRQYLQKYPDSKNATQVRNRIEDLDWKNVNRADLTSLGEFLQTHPQGQHTNEARGLIADLQKEEEGYMAAMKANNSELLQAVLTEYPKSAYAEPARQKLIQLQNKEAVLSVLHRYEDAYNKKDLNGIEELYPNCPEGVKKAYRDSFHSQEPPKLKLDPEEPEIQGTFASVKGKSTRSGALSSSSAFTLKLVKQGDKWIIQSGIL